MKIKVKTAFIKQLRNQQAWTQEALAEHSGIHSRTIQRMESEGLVSAKTLKAVAAALNVEPHQLEFATDEIDFAPLFIELRILLLAISRRLIPLDDRALPNSLIAVFTLLSFSASYTLINTLFNVYNMPQTNLESLISSGAIAVIIAFCLLFVGVVYPLFKLKAWARLLMLAICSCFVLINASLLGLMVIKAVNAEVSTFAFSAFFEYTTNLVIVFWIIHILNRDNIKRLYQPNEASEQ